MVEEISSGIIIAIIGYFFLEKINPFTLVSRFKRIIFLKKTHISSKEILFGSKNYDFYDHDDIYYLPDLVKISFQNKKKVINYNFKKTFSYNCTKIDKLKHIREFIENNEEINKIEDFANGIDRFVENKIIPKISRSKNSIICAINKISKTREDRPNRPEASSLGIDIVLMDLATCTLIDLLYDFLREKMPCIMEVNFKTNKHVYEGNNSQKTDVNYNLDNDINKLSCFITKLWVNGFVIYTNSDKKHFLIYDKKKHFSYNILMANYLLPDNISKGIDGNFLKKITIQECICKECHEYRLTDIAISYYNGINIELLGVILDNKTHNDDNNIEFNYESIRSHINRDIDYRKEHSMMYALSLVRKAENAKLDPIRLNRS